MATQPRHYQGHSERFQRTTLVRRLERRAQRTSADRARLARSGRKPEQKFTKASSGGSYDPTSGYFFIPPRVVGGARGISAPVSTATLGLIHRHDPSLAALLCEDPGSMTSQSTRRRVYSTMRLIRTGMLGQLASLQQWEEAMHRQDDA